MSDSPLMSVSIVMPTYGEQARLCAALDSLGRLDYPAAAVQLVVIDDASPDFDPLPLQRAVGPLPLHLVRHAHNQGRAQARNSGIEAATGDLVVFLDSDMTVEPDFLRQHVHLHRQQPDAVVIGHICRGPSVPDDCYTRYADSRGVKRLKAGQAVPFNYFVTGNSSLPRALLDRAGLFDADFTAYGGEDLELGYRLHRLGAPFLYAPKALSYHHHIRPLPETCRLMYTYGQASLPLLIDKHPELARLLHLELDESSSLRNLAQKLALWPPLYRLIRGITLWGLKSWVPDLFISYLIWYNRTQGFRAAQKGD